MKRIRLQAHRGVSTEAPENTMAAFRMAVDQGYDLIELDTKYTKDGVCVVLHDHTLNRTCRYPGGEVLPSSPELAIGEITLDEAMKFDAGIAMDARFSGERIPTFMQVLDFFKNNPIYCKIDNVWETFTEKQKDDFIGLVKAAGLGEKIGFSCQRIENLERVAREVPDCSLHWDGAPDEEIYKRVKELSTGHRLTFWIRFNNEATSWSPYPYATVELCDTVRKYGEVGVWILSTEEELSIALTELKPDAIETTGAIKPWMTATE
jgi:glycerophosphoryl diester phosphodiesterase